MLGSRMDFRLNNFFEIFATVENSVAVVGTVLLPVENTFSFHNKTPLFLVISKKDPSLFAKRLCAAVSFLRLQKIRIPIS